MNENAQSERAPVENSELDGGPATAVAQRPRDASAKPRRQPPYNVIIWNDETHTYEYVIDLLMTLFGHSLEAAYQITDTVHHTGRGIAFTTHKELAELKCEQVLASGADWRMDNSHGPIRASIEPAAG